MKSIKDDELVEWFIKGKINDKIINIRKLLRNDYLKIYNFLNTIQEEPLIDLLYEIYSEKNIKKEINKKKFLNFTNRRNFDFIIKKLKLDSDELWDNDFKIINDYFLNDYAFFESKYRYDEKEIHLEKLKKRKIPLIRSLFISVYIYYQNQNSTLMKYRNFEENLEIIPYEYNLSEAAIEYNLLDIVMSPLRVDPRIDEIKLHKNILKENGFKELGKILLFNKSIKKIDFHVCQIKSSHIDFLNDILCLFDNNSVGVLNLSYNYLKEDNAEYLSNILTHFKKLKSINLSCNDFKRGISSFLITLKKLYRQGKSDLESLNLNKCNLDDISYYELGELLKSKYCKLKKLYINNNNIPSNINFLKKLKKNRCLTQIYFNRSNIGNNDTNDIMRIISNCNIEYLYLNKNRISDFSQCLRIIYKTRLIKKEDKIIRENPNFYNLDLGDNICINKNADKIKLLKNIINETTLYCLDISKILYDAYPDKYIKIILNKDYITSVDDLTNKLDEEKKGYNRAIVKKNFHKNKQQLLIKMNYNEKFKMLDEQISNIVKVKKSKFNQFLKKMQKN